MMRMIPELTDELYRYNKVPVERDAIRSRLGESTYILLLVLLDIIPS